MKTNKKQFEFPVTNLVEVVIQSGILQDSPQGVQGSRRSYGTAEEQSWD